MKTAGADNVRLEPRDYDAAVKTKDHHRPDVVYWDQVEGTEFYHDLKIAWRLGTTVAPPQDAGINAAREVEASCKNSYKGCKLSLPIAGTRVASLVDLLGTTVVGRGSEERQGE